MKKILLLASLGFSLTAFSADVIPNECAFPAAKPLINAAFTAQGVSNVAYAATDTAQGVSNAAYVASFAAQAVSNTAYKAFDTAQAVSNATYAALSGLSNATLTVLNGSGTTNTIIITNGTIRIVQ
jgi:hypothetical protein